MKVKQRMLTLILSLLMIVTYMPALAFADTDDAAEADVNAVTDVQEEEAVQSESGEPGEEGEESAGVSEEAEGEEDPYVEDDGDEEDGDEEDEGEALDISYTTSQVFYENTGGEWSEREYYDEETEEYITEKYYQYNVRYFDGDILTVDGKDYTFDSSDWVYRAEDGSTIDGNDVSIGDSQYDEPWTLVDGNDTDVTYPVYYNDSSATVTAVLKPSPKYELSYVSAGSYIENVDGWTNGDEDGEWFYYDLQPAEGDVLTVDGVEYTYTGVEYESEYGWTWGMRFHNSETGENLEPDYFSMYAATSQEKEHWVLGDEEEKTFPVIVSYFGNETETSVKLIKDPIQSISYTTTYEFVENRRGYYEEDDDGEEFFYYSTHFHNGDVLTVNGEDYVYDDDSYKFVNGSERIDAEDVNIGSNQWENHWVIPEGQNETTVTLSVSYRNHTCEAEAKLIKNPVTGIEFTPVNEYADLIDGADGSFDEGIFRYELPGFEKGDQLTVTYWNKDPVTYVYEDDYFVNPDNKKDRIPTYDEWEEDNASYISVEGDQSEQWVLDGCYETTINFEGQTAPGRKVRIVKNPVESISFSRNGENKIELIPGKDSYKERDWDEETDEEYEYDYYEYDFELGDRLTVTSSEGNTSTYEYREIRLGGRTRERFVNIEDESDILEYNRIYLYTADEYRQSYKNPWEVGGNYKATVSYYGKTADINIAIIPNPVTDVELKFADGSKTAKLIEGVDGYMAREWDENDDEVNYFKYYFPEYSVGDELYVTKNGGISKYVYKSNVFDGKYYREGFVNINSDSDVIYPYDDLDERDSNQSASAPWVRGGSGYYFELSYYGFEFRVPAEVLQNPVSAIDFSRDGYDADHPIELTEGLDAEINSDGGNNRFFEYYLNFKNGDKIKITDPENNTSDYTAVPYSGGDYVKYFENDEGQKIKPYKIEQSSDQSSDNQWKPGDGTHTIDLEYFARKTGVSVKIKENPVQEISFTRPGSDAVELLEQGDGYWSGDVFRYEIDFRSEDVLNVTYADKTVKYVASEENGNVIFTAEGSVPEGAEKVINAYEFNFMHNADYKLDAEEGEQAYIMLIYKGMWTDVPVTIVDNPVEGIEFAWAEGGDRLELTEGVDGWNHHYETEDGDFDAFIYSLPYANGDILKVKYKDTDGPVSYVFNSESDAFTAQGSLPEGAPRTISANNLRCESDQSYDHPWQVDENHEFELFYLGSTFSVPVTIVKETVPECEHEYNTIAEVKATCTANGVKAHYECKKCHKLFVKEGDAYVGTTEESLVIPALGHKFGAWTKCDENQHQRVCENDSSHVEKADHNWDNGKVTKEAGCEEPGVKTYTCSACGETKTEAIPATGHVETKIDAVEPTCTEPGHKEGKKCSVCDKILVAPEVIPALGHDFGEWSIVEEPTYDKAGKKEHTCKVCKVTEAEAIPALEKTPIDDAVISGVASAMVYTGKALTPTPKVVLGDVTLQQDVDYTLTYSKNKNVGTASVVITGAGKYKGSIEKKFKINPKATSMVSASALSKGFTAKWKKLTTQTTGYQLQYSTSSSFKSGNKTVTITKNSTVTKKVTKLKAKKKYYVRVRTYKTVSGTKYYSKWSGKKTVTTKK